MLLVFVLISLLLLILYIFGVKKYNYWKEKGVPFDKPAFLFGSLKDVALGKTHLGILYKDMHSRFSDFPYVGFFTFFKPCVMINDLDIVKSIIVKDFMHFQDNDFTVDPEIDPIWSANAFMQKGDEWKKTRSAWTTSITSAKIKGLQGDFEEVADIMVNHVKKHMEQHPNEPQDIKTITSNFFADGTVSSIFGLKINSYENSDNTYSRITKLMSVSTFIDGLIGIGFIMVPKLCKFLNLGIIPKRVHKELLELTQEVITNREKGFQKNNILDSILLHTRKDTMSEIEVAGVIFSVFLNATETTSGVGAFFLHSLAANLDVQEKLRAEVDQVMDRLKENDEKLTYDILNEMPYMEMVLSETLRLYPSILLLQRTCNRPYDLPPITPGGEPVRITKGMSVVIPIYGIHMNPKHHKDPERFDPERFSPENKASMHKYAHIPFSDGPRMCLGNRFAINQLKLCMATLVRNFEIRLPTDMVGKPIRIDPNLFLYRTIDGLRATFHNRNVD